MANVPLKSIKFPGLSDTYTVPQIDDTLSVTGKAADAKKTGDEIGELKSAINDYVTKDSVDNAGISDRTYTSLFGGEFTVTTAAATGYTNFVGTVSVTSPSFSQDKNYRITINGTSYILPGRIWKVVNFSAGNYTEYNYIGNIAVRLPDVSHLVGEANVSFCIECSTNALKISTMNAGTYTILIELITETFTKIPNALLYGTSAPLIFANLDNYKISIGGANDMQASGTFAIGDCNILAGDSSMIFGYNSKTTGRYATVIGSYNIASGENSLATGVKTTASNQAAHAEGWGTTASGDRGSHAEGRETTASGQASHAEGYKCKSTAAYCHAESFTTTASGMAAHAEGAFTTASSTCAHAEGVHSIASGDASHAEGSQTIANHLNQHVFGQANIADPSNASADARGNYIEIVGNGTSNEARSNARTLDWSGNEELAGSITLGKGTVDEVTLTAAQLKALIAMLPS